MGEEIPNKKKERNGLREEINHLREEMRRLKDEMKNIAENRLRRTKGVYIDIGDRMADYIGDAVDGIAEGIHGELEKSIFIGPHGTRIFRRRTPTESQERPIDFPKTAEIMSALGHEYRLRVLKALMSGGKYINELQETLSEITTSTLSSHLDVLEKAGLVVQEKVRGRYLITIPGRSAYKMSKRIAHLSYRRDQE